jgi:hypothetical protein
MMSEFDYSILDSGIRETVRWLRLHGFMTYKSGDGRLKTSSDEGNKTLDVPFVFMVTLPEEVYAEAGRLWNLLRGLGLTRPIIELEGIQQPCSIELGVAWAAKDGVGLITLTQLDDALLLEAVGSSRRLLEAL